MLVQKIMQERGLGSWRRLVGFEAGIALVSVMGLAAVIVALQPFPTLLGRNVAQAAYLFAPMLLVPAFRNLVEYHAELLYARERTGARILLLGLLTALKAGLIALVINVMGFFGGFVLSAIKRDRGVPLWHNDIRATTGAGGLLDRVDGLCFAAPVFFHSVRWYFGL